MPRHTIPAALLAVVASAAVIPGSLNAQLAQSPGNWQPTMSLEALKPSFENNDWNPRWTTQTAAFFLSTRIPVNERLRIVADLPFSHAGIKGGDGYPGATSNAIGNPYIGLEARTSASAVTTEVGMRVPAAHASGDDDFAIGMGMVADMDRMEAFLPDLLTLSGAARYDYVAPEGLYLQLRAGPTLWVYTGPEEMEETTELWAQYGARIGYRAGLVDVSGGLTGRAILTEEGSYNDRSFHHLGLDTSLALGRLHPGLHLRVPMDDELSRFMSLSYVVGLSLTVQLR